MATAFHRVEDRIVAGLDADERAIVVELLAQTHSLIAPEERVSSGDAFTDLVSQLDDTYDADELAGRDPVVRRLLPDGHRDDPDAASEFREATERGLREQKAGRLADAVGALLAVPHEADTVSLEPPQAVALMMALADTRLALGERLGLHTDEDSEELQERVERLGPDDPVDERTAVGLYYDFLTWLQESLALVLMP